MCREKYQKLAKNRSNILSPHKSQHIINIYVPDFIVSKLFEYTINYPY